MKYHPDIELLLQYTSGQLQPSLAIGIGLHHQNCSECQALVRNLEQVGGTTLESIPVTQASTDSGDNEQIILNDFERLMSDIGDQPATQSTESAYDQLAVSEIDKQLVKQLNVGDFEHFNWQRVSPKIWKAKVPLNDPGYEVELLKFAPNAHIPQHTHEGNEYTVVVEGDFSDAAGQYVEGEFIAQDASHEHSPVAGKNGCICLAITDAPLKFTGTFGPILNWFAH